MANKRKEAIQWIKAFRGQVIGTTLDVASWNDIYPINRIAGYAMDSIPLEYAVKWGIEEGAIAMLEKLFDITEEEIYGR